MKNHGINRSDSIALFRSVVIYLIVISMSGIDGLATPVYSAAGDSAAPVLHHPVPMSMTQGEDVVIRVEVNDDSDIAGVYLWHRAAGKSGYAKTDMTPVSDTAYEGRISVTEGYKEGLEYYIVALDRNGHEGGDGAEAVPYFVEVREMHVLAGLSTGDVRKSGKRPWWKNPWLWAGITAITGGVIAATTNRGGDDDNGNGSGTVVVH